MPWDVGSFRTSCGLVVAWKQTEGAVARWPADGRLVGLQFLSCCLHFWVHIFLKLKNQSAQKIKFSIPWLFFLFLFSKLKSRVSAPSALRLPPGTKTSRRSRALLQRSNHILFVLFCPLHWDAWTLFEVPSNSSRLQCHRTLVDWPTPGLASLKTFLSLRRNPRRKVTCLKDDVRSGRFRLDHKPATSSVVAASSNALVTSSDALVTSSC